MPEGTWVQIEIVKKGDPLWNMAPGPWLRDEWITEEWWQGRRIVRLWRCVL